MPDRAEQMRQVLAGLADGRTHWGAAVVSRDGIIVATSMARPVSEDSFGAMTAAMLGAAEAAMEEWSDDRPQRATIDGGTVRILALGLDNSFFLAVVSPLAAAATSGTGDVDAAATKLRSILKAQVVLA